jgi:3-oxoacyl-[acyl-carrier-protein] synthase III
MSESGRFRAARVGEHPGCSVATSETVGISAIAVYEPPWRLSNDWFGTSIPRKFVQHTGINSRCISEEDEITMALRAAESLQRELDFDLRDCVGVVLASPSLVPGVVARKYFDGVFVRRESPNYVARQFANRLGLAVDRVVGINWFCSGYAKALSLVKHCILPKMTLRPDQFLLVATASRISRITDYSCAQTAPLFGDMATLTVLAKVDSQKYPVHFVLVGASAEMMPVDGVLFDFHWRRNVLVPTREGSCDRDPQRLVFSLNGLGIGDAAPRAMAKATADLIRMAGVRREDVRFVVPHQAGSAIVRFATMELEALGIGGEVINGLTSEVGNVSSCSIPYALKQAWHVLDGTIACPSAGVGPPGEARVSQGCILLRAPQHHGGSG